MVKWLRVEDLKDILEEREARGEKPMWVFRCVSCEKMGEQFIFRKEDDVRCHLESAHDLGASSIERLLKSAFHVPLAGAGLSDSKDYLLYGKRQRTTR